MRAKGMTIEKVRPEGADPRTTQSRPNTLEEQYLSVFAPLETPSWKQPSDDVSLEQPWPFDFVETNTTYGIAAP